MNQSTVASTYSTEKLCTRLKNWLLDRNSYFCPSGRKVVFSAAIFARGGAEGNAVRFSAIYDEYRQAPDVTRRRLYLETMQRILPKVGRKLFVAKDATGVLPLLTLDGTTPRLTPAPVVPAQTAGGDQ